MRSIGKNDIDFLLKRKRRQIVEQQITQSAPAHSRDHHENQNTKQVDFLANSKLGPRSGKGRCADKVKDIKDAHRMEDPNVSSGVVEHLLWCETSFFAFH